MSDVRLVIHGHFYQPPRENPWTEQVGIEPSAAPFHDWNERITAESYRPNGWARVWDDRGGLVDIIDNYRHLSFNFGPTLLSWLEVHAPEVYRRVQEGDREGGGAIAQAYNHLIMPLANQRDMRTQIRWGLADFAHRFGRPAAGLWLPETAVNDEVLAVLVEEGVRFTILAPGQAVAVRVLAADGSRAPGDDGWADVSGGQIPGGMPQRWFHPDGRHIDLMFYDGGISHDLAFGLTGMSTQELVRRVLDDGADGTPVCVATDGETFGHHHKFAERALAFAFAHELEANGVTVLHAADLIDQVPPRSEVRVQESAWSCAHGVGRWHTDCGCSTGGGPGWNQRWRAPLRDALDLLRDHGVEVFERRGAEVLADPWAARDAYVEVVLGARTVDDFLAAHLVPGADEVSALTLLEAQRNAMLMYTSCGWFFNDLGGLETVQVLRYAAATADLLALAGEPAPMEAFLAVLEGAVSNQAGVGTGRDIWFGEVEPSRVDADRVVAHLALVSLLQSPDIPAEVGGFDVLEHHPRTWGRGGLEMVSGSLTLRHHRTRRVTRHVYATLLLGALEVWGATRLAEPARDPSAFAGLAALVEGGERWSAMLRYVGEAFGPREFGLESALPGAAEQIVAGAAETLADRFRASYERLYADHRATLHALVVAGLPLPAELRAPAEFALARRFEHEVAAAGDDLTRRSLSAAEELVREARVAGLQLATPRAAEVMEAAVLRAVERATGDPTAAQVTSALELLELTTDLDVWVDKSRAQELVFDAVRRQPEAGGPLAALASALGISP